MSTSLYAAAQSVVARRGDRAERALSVAATREVELFNLALRANSNLEMDWLWLSMQLIDASRRRYCLERALAINPESAIARRELAIMGSSAAL